MIIQGGTEKKKNILLIPRRPNSLPPVDGQAFQKHMNTKTTRIGSNGVSSSLFGVKQVYGHLATVINEVT